MPSMMAIISKKLFESEQGRLEGRLARLGDLLPLESYLSSNKRLEALSGGGALFLVTVRPSERLWLVAVLEKPRFICKRSVKLVRLTGDDLPHLCSDAAVSIISEI